MTPLALAEAARKSANRLGFLACGITDLRPSETRGALERWLAAGRHGTMTWMQRQAARRAQPSLIWPEARSAVVVLHDYYTDDTATARGYRVARYAQSQDYHRVTLELLGALGDDIARLANGGSFKYFADAGPLPERELAWRSGLGWFGKNTMIIHPEHGSWFFIGVLLTDLELAKDEPFDADRCGSCTRCLDACPTGAFPEPRVLDASRCISYLTIEHRAPFNPEQARAIGDHLFGCDICQEVCPWNEKFARPTSQRDFAALPPDSWPTLEQLLAMDDAAFTARFGPTPLERARRAGLQRNARAIQEQLTPPRAATPSR